MIRGVMVWLDGGVGDEIRLTAVEDLARRLESEAVIGLYLNPLPLPGAIDGDISADLLDRARKIGDQTEAALAKRLSLLDRPVEIRRLDVLADDIANVAAREGALCRHFRGASPQWLNGSGRSGRGCLVRVRTKHLFSA